MRTLRERTHEKNELIRKHHKLIEVWACDLKNDKEYRKFEKLDYISPLDPRDAFFGGQTEVFRLKWEKHDDKVMHTGDFTSLYPAGNSFEDYPVGHSEIIYEPKEYDQNWFGPINFKFYRRESCTFLCFRTDQTNYFLVSKQ